jgi:MerR family transcriptional regulator, light-induced transcriptional regulator
MATVFRISELKSKLGDWRTSRKSTHLPDLAPAESEEARLTLVNRYEEDYDLSLLLQNLVIPRLVAGRVAHDIAPDASKMAWREFAPGTAISDADVEVFAKLSITGEAHMLCEILDVYLAKGIAVETIYIQLLAPAARILGTYWEDDSLDFVAVTMGLWRIQEVLRELTVRVPPKSRQTYGHRSALFAPMPGEQHSLGTLMVSECFQRAGWETEVLIEPTQSEFTSKFADCHFDLIGLTVSCDSSTAALGNLVKTIKVVSCNPRIRIMLGGAAINSRPELVADCGADGTASDAVQAVVVADSLVPQKFERHGAFI